MGAGGPCYVLSGLYTGQSYSGHGRKGREAGQSRLVGVTGTPKQTSAGFPGPVGSFCILLSLGKLWGDKFTGSQPKSWVTACEVDCD